MSETIVGALLALAGVAVTAAVGLWAQRQNNSHQERMLRVQLAETKKREILHEVFEGLTAHYEALHRREEHDFTPDFQSAANLVWVYCDPQTNGAINRFAMLPATSHPAMAPPAEELEAAYLGASEAIRRELNPVEVGSKASRALSVSP